MSETWSETDSELYRRLAPVAVPDRAEQIAAILTLVPYAEDATFRIVELACGEGLLALALLTLFRQARYLGLDGSDSMRAAAAVRLAAFGSRAQTARFELAAQDWLPQADGAGLIVSSLAVHHLPDEGKRVLYRALCPRLAADGALLLADLVAPARAEIADLFAGSWDCAVERQARRLPDGGARIAAFRKAHWNHFRYPDPVDQPSKLSDQLRWLSEAGFVVADCFWLRAGHAIYGGYRAGNRAVPADRFARAVEIAEKTLGVAR